MEVSESGLRKRRTRRFRAAEEKRRIVEETLQPGTSVATVSRAHGINANQVFHWRKLYEAGLLEGAEAAGSAGDPPRSVRMLPVTIDEEGERQARDLAVPPTFSDVTRVVAAGLIELTLARGSVRVTGDVDAGTLRTVLRCLLA